MVRKPPKRHPVLLLTTIITPSPFLCFGFGRSQGQMVRKPPKHHQQEEPEELEDDEDAVDADGHNNNIVYRGDSEDPNPHQQPSRPDPNPEETEVNIIYRQDSKDPNPHQQPNRPDPNPKETEVNIVYRGDSKDPNPHQQPSRPDPNPKETEVLIYRGVRECDFPPVKRLAVNRPHVSVIEIVAAESVN